MNKRRPGPSCLVLAVAATMAPGPLTAQIKASERGGVHQTIDGTTITIDYSRPRARGRSPLFGGDVVHWGHVWTPGADWATTLEIDKPVRIQGTVVPVGKYSVWFVVQDTTAWEVWLEPKDSLFHIPEPKRTDDQIHFWADVEQHDYYFETLTWSFPEIRMTGATLAMQWGTTYVPLDVAVESTVDLIVTAEAAAAVVGWYRMTGEGERDWANRDVDLVYDPERSWILSTWTARHAEDVEAEADESHGDDDAEHVHDDDAESAHADHSADVDTEEEEEQPPWEAALFPVADGWFTPGWMEDGELWAVNKSWTIEFDYQDGIATGYQIRNRRDEVVATAVRVTESHP